MLKTNYTCPYCKNKTLIPYKNLVGVYMYECLHCAKEKYPINDIMAFSKTKIGRYIKLKKLQKERK